MPFSHNGIKTTTGIQLSSVSRVHKYTLSYRFLNGNVHGRVFAKNRPVSLNWTDCTEVVERLQCYRKSINVPLRENIGI